MEDNKKSKRPDLAARNKARATHCMSKTSTYCIWRSMLQRCENLKREDFSRYGGRGIRVCPEWHEFAVFLADMGPRPDGMTLERLNGCEDYCSTNCVWATPKQQARNRSNNVLILHNGTTATIAEWAEHVGLERKTLEYRIRKGWAPAVALTTPSLCNRKAINV